MKLLVTIAIFAITAVGFSQNKNARATMEVDGVCMMCKERIEKACIKTRGVKSAVWDVKTKELSLIYDERKTTLETVAQNIANVGHDTKQITATDEAYDSVHACCKYRSEEVQEEHGN